MDREEVGSVTTNESGALAPSGGYENSMLATFTRAEIDTQIATARAYPRSIAKFQKDALTVATIDVETASSMFYTLPRKENGKTKNIIGPSARLAEVVGSCWGNMRYGARIIDVGDTFITAQGVAIDLEKNVAIQVEVRRRIVSRDGKRYGDDMIVTTGNAATSIALRNAIFKVVPFALVKGVFDRCKAVATGETLPMSQRRKNALDWFSGQGVNDKRVLARVGRRAVEDLTVEDLEVLTGLRTAIMDGEISIDSAFDEEDAEQKSVHVSVASLRPATPAEAPAPATAPEARPVEVKPEEAKPTKAVEPGKVEVPKKGNLAAAAAEMFS